MRILVQNLPPLTPRRARAREQMLTEALAQCSEPTDMVVHYTQCPAFSIQDDTPEDAAEEALAACDCPRFVVGIRN